MMMVNPEEEKKSVEFAEQKFDGQISGAPTVSDDEDEDDDDSEKAHDGNDNDSENAHNGSNDDDDNDSDGEDIDSDHGGQYTGKGLELESDSEAEADPEEDANAKKSSYGGKVYNINDMQHKHEPDDGTDDGNSSKPGTIHIVADVAANQMRSKAMSSMRCFGSIRSDHSSLGIHGASTNNRNLRRKSSSEDPSESSGSESDEEFYDADTIDVSEKANAKSAATILQKLQKNDERYDTLELHLDATALSLSDLIRGLCSNRTVQHVTVTDTFMEFLGFEKSRVILEVLGGLPFLESLTIKFPSRRLFGSPAVLLQSALQKNSPLLLQITTHNLQLTQNGDEVVLAEAFGMAPKLCKLRLFEFYVHKKVEVDQFFMPLIKLKSLEELEIRMKKQQSLPDLGFATLCGSPSLKSLIIWNMTFDTIQSTHVCDALVKNKKLERFELWCCSLQKPQDMIFNNDEIDDTNPFNEDNEISDSVIVDNVGVALAQILDSNTSLRTVVFSHIGLDEKGCMSLLDGLKNNTTLCDLALLNVTDENTYALSEHAATAIESMFMNNTGLQSLTVTWNHLNEEECKAYALELDRNTLLRTSGRREKLREGCVIQ